MSDPKVKFRYVGTAQFANVPAEDITDEMYERMDAGLRRIVLRSGQWEPVKAADKKAAKQRESTEDARDEQAKDGGA